MLTRSIGLTASIAAVWLLTSANNAAAATSVSAGAGTLGLTGALGFPLGESMTGRIGYGALSYHGSMNDTHALYEGKLRLRNASALLDWHPGRHSFQFSIGGVASRNRIDIDAVPTGGSFELGGATYSALQVRSVTGSIRPGRSFAPYVGLGFSSGIRNDYHLSIMFDVGVVLSGSPEVTLTASCAPSLPATVCAQVQQDAAAEIASLRDKTALLKAWPVVNFGVAWRL